MAHKKTIQLRRSAKTAVANEAALRLELQQPSAKHKTWLQTLPVSGGKPGGKPPAQ
jgi:hypothetical protein